MTRTRAYARTRTLITVPLGNQLLQPRVLLLEPFQAPHVVRLESPKAPAPSVDRLLAEPVPLGNRRHRIAIRLADDRHHLLFREPRLPHRSLRIGSQSLTLSMVRNLGGRSIKGAQCASAPT